MEPERQTKDASNTSEATGLAFLSEHEYNFF
jgi:hypothetical protein